jgi:hypothetical protein
MTNLYRFLCFFCISLIAPSAMATNYYASVNGDDNNTGTFFSPWRTVQYGADQLGPGDVLFLLPGVFTEKVTLHVSGTPTDRITIAPYTTDIPVIDASGITGQDAVIEITDQSYIDISGIELRNNVMNDAQGILIQGNCRGIRILYNVIHDIHFSANPNDVANENTNAQGIIVFGSDAANPVTDLVIWGNELYDCRLGYSEGIAVNGNVDGFTVRDNYVHDLTNIGIVAIGHEETCPDPLLDQARNGVIHNNRVVNCNSPYAACGGIYIDGAKDTRILYNSVRGNDYGIEVGCEHPGKSAANITVRNNIIRDNVIAGIAFGGYDFPANSGKITDCSIYNNDFYKNDSLYDGNGDLVISYAENCLVENNLFYTNHQRRAVTFADAATTTVNLNYNLYFTPDNDQGSLIGLPNNEVTLAQFQGLGQEANGLFADPLLEVTDDDNSFRLTQPNTPCADAGNPDYQLVPDETDFFGQPRIWAFSTGPIVDIGACELIVGALEEPETVSAIVFPNPASATIGIQSAEMWETIEILDLTGKIVLTRVADGNPVSIVALEPGQYIVRCSNNAAVSYTTLIKM